MTPFFDLEREKKRKENNKKFIEEIIFKYKLEFSIDDRMFF